MKGKALSNSKGVISMTKLKAEKQKRICPICKREYQSVPSISRIDDKTLICPDCGTRQALESINISKEEQEQILKIIHRSQSCE